MGNEDVVNKWDQQFLELEPYGSDDGNNATCAIGFFINKSSWPIHPILHGEVITQINSIKLKSLSGNRNFRTVEFYLKIFLLGHIW